MEVFDIERLGWNASTDKPSINVNQIVNAIQRPDLNPLDLLVRECVQNSLDSALDMKNKRTSVEVQFFHQGFNASDFLKLLGAESCKAFTEFLKQDRMANARLLAVRDTGTIGVDGQYEDEDSRVYKLMTGFLNGKTVSRGESNLGGSHGAGKTVVLKLGIGLVVYYTRTKDGESRLWVYYCENGAGKVFDKAVAKKELMFLPKKLAWWGKMRLGKDNSVEPATDGNLISRTLKALGLPEFAEDESGTIIAVPFVDDSQMLSSIKKSCEDQLSDDRPAPSWTQSIVGYLEHAVVKWYAPRLTDLSDDPMRFRYPWGPALRCSFVDDGVEYGVNAASEDYRAYRLVHRLFHLATDSRHSASSGVIAGTPYKINIPTGKKWRSSWFTLRGSDCVGHLAVIKLQRDAPEASVLFADGTGDTCLVYSRSPGLVLTYGDYEWSKALWGYPRQPDELMFGIFVPDVDNEIHPDVMFALHGLDDRFEAPFRESEGFDHGAWPKDSVWPMNADFKYGGYRFLNTVLYKITQEITRLGDAEQQNPDKNPTRAVSVGALWGQFFGLGGSGFGGPRTNPGGGMGRNVKPGKGKGTSKTSKTSKLSTGEPSYSRVDGRLVIARRVEIDFGDPPEQIVIGISVAVGSKRVTSDSWMKDLENNQTAEPFPARFRSVLCDSICDYKFNQDRTAVTLTKGSAQKLKGTLVYELSRDDVVSDFKYDHVPMLVKEVL